MSLENSPTGPLDEEAIAIEVAQFAIALPEPRVFWDQANRERRALFEEVYDSLNDLQYNTPSESSSQELQGFYRWWININGAPREHNAVVARIPHAAPRTTAWHIIVNETNQEDGRKSIRYSEYMLPIGQRFIDFRYHTATCLDTEHWNYTNLENTALLIGRSDDFVVYRGKYNELLTPPTSWQDTHTAERFTIHDRLQYLLDRLDEMHDHHALVDGVIGRLL
jgi:hypothetical protein